LNKLVGVTEWEMKKLPVSFEAVFFPNKHGRIGIFLHALTLRCYGSKDITAQPSIGVIYRCTTFPNDRSYLPCWVNSTQTRTYEQRQTQGIYASSWPVACVRKDPCPPLSLDVLAIKISDTHVNEFYVPKWYMYLTRLIQCDFNELHKLPKEKQYRFAGSCQSTHIPVRHGRTSYGYNCPENQELAHALCPILDWIWSICFPSDKGTVYITTCDFIISQTL
jgi:hypothetical protein